MESICHCLILHKAVVIDIIPACNNFTVRVNIELLTAYLLIKRITIYSNEMSNLTIIKLQRK